MIRAGRNKTLTLSDEDRRLLETKILSPFDISSSNYEDSVINANLEKVIGKLPADFADLIILDPPYNLSKNFGTVQFNAMSSRHYIDYLNSWFPLVCEKLKDTGSIYVCGDWKCTSAIQTVLEESGLTVMNRITWQRDKGRGAKANWKNNMEDIWFAVRNPKAYYFDLEAVKIKRRVLAPYKENDKPKDWEETEDGKYRRTCPSNFWDDISVPFWSMPENTDHPTQKPEKLIAKLILASSCEGDMVFDPFLGSGTTAVVAKKLNRHYCGIEINREYCLFAAKRLSNAEKDCAIQGYKDNVFLDKNCH